MTKEYYNVLQDLCSEMFNIEANIDPVQSKLSLYDTFDNLENIFTETSKVTKLYRHDTVMPIYTRALEVEPHDNDGDDDDDYNGKVKATYSESWQDRTRMGHPSHSATYCHLLSLGYYNNIPTPLTGLYWPPRQVHA